MANRRAGPTLEKSHADYDHQQITDQAQALDLTGLSDKDKTIKIHDWITHNIAYDIDYADLPWLPASEVLNVRKGVCKDYAVLFAALARASGLPCRIIVGEVNIGDRMAGLHAWNEVLIEDGWVPVDASLDAGYINAQSQFVFKYSSDYLLPASPYFALTHKASYISPY